MSTVVFCYSRVYYTVRQHNNAVVPSLQSAAATDGHGIVRAQEIKTSRVLFAAVLGILVCWTSFMTILILEFGSQIAIPLTIQPIYPLLSIFSSWINPITFVIKNRAMRKEFGNTLFCRKH